MKTLRIIAAGVCAMIVMVLSMPNTHAATITKADITEQQRVVLIDIVVLLEDHLKLLQMAYIRRLEAQVASLQARIDASK